ncbi:hypothetical protein J6S88_00520 [bacterium]|nr:hypothetical protein [bacterium]
MDKELLKRYFSMFRVSIGIAAGALVLAIVLLMIAVPKMTGSFQNIKKLGEDKASLGQKRTEVQRLKDNIAQAEAARIPDNEMKVFYKNIKAAGGLSADILAGEVQEINDLIKYYGIKVYKVNYTYDDENDPFYKSEKDKYSVCRMDLELFSNYMKFQGFLKDLYKHEHFLDIQSVDIKPYKKDKSILDIVMVLNLYAEKTGNAAAGGGVPAPNAGELSVEF